MALSKEAELVTSVLLYASRCMAEGDQVALRSLNFGTRELEALRGLDLADLHRLAEVHGHCLEIALNRDSFWLIVQHMQHERSNEVAQHALIRADAPYEMMRALFGLDSRTYTTLRNLAGVRPAAGRPTAPEEGESTRLWEALKDHQGEVDPQRLAPTDYLELYQETAIPLRTQWQLLQRWAEEGRQQPGDSQVPPGTARVGAA